MKLESAPAPGSTDDLVAELDQLLDGVGRGSDACLPCLSLLRNPDPHARPNLPISAVFQQATTNFRLSKYRVSAISAWAVTQTGV